MWRKELPGQQKHVVSATQAIGRKEEEYG